MKLNSNIIQMIVVAVGMFTVGGVLNGERISRKSDRNKIKQIELQQKEILYRVDSLYANAIAQERVILERIDSNYIILDALYDKKVLTQKQYQYHKQNIVSQKTSISDQVKKLDRMGREFIFKSRN